MQIGLVSFKYFNISDRYFLTCLEDVFFFEAGICIFGRQYNDAMSRLSGHPIKRIYDSSAREKLLLFMNFLLYYCVF